jgi:hypothetical protein
MPGTAAFYSVNEAKKPAAKRVHHDNSACGPGKDIPFADKRYGKGPIGDEYRLCEDCETINKKEAAEKEAAARRRL